ncbi:hypothetical protein DFH27DRAFT_631696 [Peziza echinospora]|nr:hypothetical protein DFH27DRAFT_631696 [Peziza echinospora]
MEGAGRGLKGRGPHLSGQSHQGGRARVARKKRGAAASLGKCRVRVASSPGVREGSLIGEGLTLRAKWAFVWSCRGDRRQERQSRGHDSISRLPCVCVCGRKVAPHPWALGGRRAHLWQTVHWHRPGSPTQDLASIIKHVVSTGNKPPRKSLSHGAGAVCLKDMTADCTAKYPFLALTYARGQVGVHWPPAREGSALQGTGALDKGPKFFMGVHWHQARVTPGFREFGAIVGRWIGIEWRAARATRLASTAATAPADHESAVRPRLRPRPGRRPLASSE